MQVSAISVNHNKGYKFSNNKPFYNNQTSETNNDTAFNSLTPYAIEKPFLQKKCHKFLIILTNGKIFVTSKF